MTLNSLLLGHALRCEEYSQYDTLSYFVSNVNQYSHSLSLLSLKLLAKTLLVKISFKPNCQYSSIRFFKMGIQNKNEMYLGDDPLDPLL